MNIKLPKPAIYADNGVEAFSADQMKAAQPEPQAEAVARIERRFGGYRIVAPDGKPFDMTKYEGKTLYTTPQPAAVSSFVPTVILREDILRAKSQCTPIQEAYSKGGELGLVEWLHQYSRHLLDNKYKEHQLKLTAPRQESAISEFRRTEHGTFPHNI